MKKRYRLLLPYIIIVFITYLLKNTGLNTCGADNTTGACFGQLDFFLLLLSFPGWLTWMAVNIIPSVLNLAFLKVILTALTALSIEFNTFFIPSSFILSGIILYFLGMIMEYYTVSEEEHVLTV